MLTREPLTLLNLKTAEKSPLIRVDRQILICACICTWLWSEVKFESLMRPHARKNAKFSIFPSFWIYGQIIVNCFILSFVLLQVFDALVVLITFLLDLIFFVSGLEDMHPGVRALTFLIILRLWRFYGIYHGKCIEFISKNILCVSYVHSSCFYGLMLTVSRNDKIRCKLGSNFDVGIKKEGKKVKK